MMIQSPRVAKTANNKSRLNLLACVSGEFVIFDGSFAGGPEVTELAVIGLLAQVIQFVNLQGLRS